jgi:rhodanese-related sulfurtransferase
MDGVRCDVRRCRCFTAAIIITVGQFLNRRAAVQAVQQAHAVDFIRKESVRNVRRLLGGDTIFVDARFATDYDRAHLPGAINLPVDLDGQGLRQRVIALDRDARIVVYCQSAACPFAGVVARRLISEGFRRVSIYRAGWATWQDEQSGG